MSFNDGNFEGVANGYHDIIKVKVKVTDGRIEKIEYEHKDTPDTGGLAIQHIVEQIIKKQTTEVPRVPGARYSSIGVIEAVKKSLAVSEGSITQEEASQIRRQKTDGEFSINEPGNMITVVVDQEENTEKDKFRFVGGSLEHDILELLLEVIPFEFRVFDQHARLQYFNHKEENKHTNFNNLGMHIVDLHNENDFFEKFKSFRTSDISKLELVSNQTLVKLMKNDVLVGFVEY